MTIQDSILKKVIEAMISRANAKFDMNDIMKSYQAESRTVNIVITDIQDGYGFGIRDGSIVLDTIDNPTCVMSMNKKTFSAIITGKLSNSQAFFMNLMEITGNDWLRDSIAINKIFELLKDTMLKRNKK